MRQNIQKGFTLAEILVAIALIGVLAAIVIPKIINSSTQKNRNAIAKDIFVTVGESFLACQNSGNCNTAGNDWNNSPVVNNVGTSTPKVSNQFINYLKSHVDITSDLSALPYRLSTGAQMNTFSTPAYTGSLNRDWLGVDLSIPPHKVPNDHFLVVFQRNTAIVPNAVTRYTTKYGITRNAADRTFLDTNVLKI